MDCIRNFHIFLIFVYYLNNKKYKGHVFYSFWLLFNHLFHSSLHSRIGRKRKVSSNSLPLMPKSCTLHSFQASIEVSKFLFSLSSLFHVWDVNFSPKFRTSWTLEMVFFHFSLNWLASIHFLDISWTYKHRLVHLKWNAQFSLENKGWQNFIVG